MAVPLILCIGSPLGIDQTGWRAARWLRNYFDKELKEGLFEVAELDRPGIGLIDWLHKRSKVVIIDAMVSGAEPGTVHDVNLDELLCAPSSPSSHNFGVAEALCLAQSMGDLPEQLIIFGIEVAEGMKEEAWLPNLTPQLERVLR